MMELFCLEHKKLWRRGTTRGCVLVCFVYAVLFGCILSFQWITFGSSNHTDSFENNFDGYNMIRDCQAYARAFGDKLTDEAFQQMVRDYQEAEAAGRETQLTDWYKLQSWISTLYPELVDSGTYQLALSYVNPDRLTGFYERRQQAVETFLEISGQVGRERDYLMRMEQRVQKPFRYEWTEGWSVVLTSVAGETGIVLAVFLAIVLAPLFAGEWKNETNVLILTTENGWHKTAFAKILAGLSFTLEFFAVIAVGQVASQLFFLGTAGWDMPVQNIKLIAVAPMNMLQAELYEYAFILLGMLGYAGVVMLLSAVIRSSVLTLVSGLAAVFVPVAMDSYLPFWLQKTKDLLPLVGSGTDIFRTNTLCIFGKYIWLPYLLVTIPVLIGACCIPFAVRGWSRRMKV